MYSNRHFTSPLTWIGTSLSASLLLVAACASTPMEPDVVPEPAPSPTAPSVGAISAEFPYESQFVEVLGSNMHYIDIGEGDPIVFLHGNPTSSYLWRNVIPFVKEQGRVIAVDNIGFGKSDKPDIDYQFQTHYEYIEAFIAILDLRNVTLVIHDWGSILGLNYARLNEGNVKAVAFMEALVPPAFPLDSIEGLGDFADLFRQFRDPELGPEVLIEQNMFIEGILANDPVTRSFSAEELDAYRMPFIEKEARFPIYVWPNELPIAGEPARNVEVIASIADWLQVSNTPKLLLYASPGAVIPPAAVPWMTANYNNLEAVFIGYGRHFVQEDSPEAIGRNIAQWLQRIDVTPAQALR